jgi:hypothetical protein
MTRSTILLMVFFLVFCFGESAFAQHGGFGGAADRAFGIGAGKGLVACRARPMEGHKATLATN